MQNIANASPRNCHSLFSVETLNLASLLRIPKESTFIRSDLSYILGAGRFLPPTLRCPTETPFPFTPPPSRTLTRSRTSYTIASKPAQLLSFRRARQALRAPQYPSPPLLSSIRIFPRRPIRRRRPLRLRNSRFRQFFLSHLPTSPLPAWETFAMGSLRMRLDRHQTR